MVGSVFDVTAACFRLGEFDWAEEEFLRGKHAVESRRRVDPAANERTYSQIAGLSRLENAVCEEVGCEGAPGRDRSHAIAEGEIGTAGAVLVAGRMMHPDQFADGLREERGWPVTEFSESLFQCGANQANVPCISRSMELEKHREPQAATDCKR